MNNVLYVSFYTEDFAYPKARLEASLDRFGLKHEITYIDIPGTWRDRIAMKPRFITHELSRVPEGDCIVWLDADSVVMQNPEHFLHIKGDIAYCEKRLHQPHAAVLFLRNTKRTRVVCCDWVARTERRPVDSKCLDQAALRGAMLGVAHETLPESYNVFVNPETAKQMKDPVIVTTRWLRWGKTI